MVGSKKEFVITKAQTHGPWHSVPLIRAKCDTTQLFRRPHTQKLLIAFKISLFLLFHLRGKSRFSRIATKKFYIINNSLNFSSLSLSLSLSLQKFQDPSILNETSTDLCETFRELGLPLFLNLCNRSYSMAKAGRQRSAAKANNCNCCKII